MQCTTARLVPQVWARPPWPQPQASQELSPPIRYVSHHPCPRPHCSSPLPLCGFANASLALSGLAPCLAVCPTWPALPLPSGPHSPPFSLPAEMAPLRIAHLLHIWPPSVLVLSPCTVPQRSRSCWFCLALQMGPDTQGCSGKMCLVNGLDPEVS